jgi:phospholipid/cholesterol/gamma-HCH transport system substrate-binding protein
MPQRKELKWAQLRVGAMATASLVVLAVGIFFISSQVGFLTRRYTLRAYFSTAGGLREGAQVQLAGVPAGNVTRIRISAYQDPSRAVEVEMKIIKKYQEQIRADSIASTESQGLLGERYIDVSRGSASQPVVPAGGELKSSESADIKRILENANDVISNMRVLSAKLNDITNEITAGQGSFGKFLYDPEMYNRLNLTAGRAATLVADLQHGRGSLGKLLNDEALYQRLVDTVDRANHMLDNIQNGQGTIAKFINDPSVYDNLNKTVTQAQAVITKVNEGQGTLGKAINDTQLYDRMNSTVAHVDSITERMDSGQGSLGLLSTNDKLYQSLSQSATSLSEFLTEFKQNPKKYLTVKVKIF